MNPTEAGWQATVEVRTVDGRAADTLERALRPEASREVPRATVAIRRPAPSLLEIRVATHDAGAMRAALNTYLGWVQLAFAAMDASRPRPRNSPP